MDANLLALLRCPHDRSALAESRGALECPTCARRFPVSDGLVSFLSPEELEDEERSELASRDAESSWYDTMFEGYTNAVEVPTVVARIGRPTGPVLDHGAGTGRITERLTGFGQPVVAVDYSGESLRKLLKRCAGASVLAVQADVRRLPLKDQAFHAATSIEVYEHIRGRDERRRVLEELSRVLRPGAPLSISSFNYNLLYRVWSLLGNEGAREGEHLLGGDFYYRRMTREEFRRELQAVFDVKELTGIRNIPARTLAGLVRRAGFRGAADRFLDWMVERGHRLDFALERTPLASQLGFFWLAKAVRRP